MTDAELRDAAWKELTLTTDSYPKWKSKGYPANTHWGKAKALLDQIGKQVVVYPSTSRYPSEVI